MPPITAQTRVLMDPIAPPPSTKSDFNVEVVRLKDIQPHSNADRLDIATVNGLPVVIRRGDFHVGDLAIYVPVDALVPVENPAFAFLKDSKGRPQARIRAARLRGVYSEGLLVPVTALPGDGHPLQEGRNVQADLKIEKWLSSADRAESQGGMLANPGSKRSLAREVNKVMPIYGLDSIQRFPWAIGEGRTVTITEKIHGSNARYTFQKGRFWIGSHRTLRRVSSHRLVMALKALWAFFMGLFAPRKANGYYAETLGDIWVQMAEKYKLEEKCRQVPGLVIYGEIYGKGLQSRGGVAFTYDSPDGLAFRVFDIYDAASGEYLSFDEMRALCEKLDLPIVPVVLHAVSWLGVKEEEACTRGKSMIGGHIREGIVVRDDVYARDRSRKAYKFVSADYKLLGEAGE